MATATCAWVSVILTRSPALYLHACVGTEALTQVNQLCATLSSLPAYYRDFYARRALAQLVAILPATSDDARPCGTTPPYLDVVSSQAKQYVDPADNGVESMLSVMALEAMVATQGALVRKLKAAKGSVEDIKDAVAILLQLKKQMAIAFERERVRGISES